MINELTDHLSQLTNDIDNNSSLYLLGSYSTNSYSNSSDIDYLIITDYKKNMLKAITKNLKSNYKSIYPKLDIKIISNLDVNTYRDNNYLMIYSMLKYGKLIHGKPISIKFDELKLYHSLTKQVDELLDLEEMINIKQDSITIGCLLFNIGKSLHYIDKIIDPDNYKSLKQIFTNYLSYIGRSYEMKTRNTKGIMTNISSTIKFNDSQKGKGNYEKLSLLVNKLREYEAQLSKKFDY